MAFFIPTILVQGIYTGIIGTISSVTIGTCSMIKTIYTHQNPDANQILKELDIERKITLIQSVLNTIDHESKSKMASVKLNELEKTQIFELIHSEQELYNDPIELCLMYLHETIQNIHDDLLAINNKVTNHQNKWFHKWRTLNIKPMIERIRLNSKLLTERFEDLTKIAIFLRQK